MQGLLVGSALLAQAMLLQWTQPYTLLHSFVAVPFSFVAFTVGFFFLAKTFLVTPLFFLPAILIAKVTNTDQQLQEFLAASEASDADVNRIKIPTPDGVQLDAITIKQPDANVWVVFCNANGVVYEHNLDFLALYSRALPANVLSFNYRGVGASTGWPYSGDDLVTDGKAAVQHLVDMGVNPGRIVLHGHSLGGGVATQTAHAFQDAKLIHDRSFRSMSRAAQVILPQVNGLMSAIFAGILGLAAHTTIRFSAFADDVPRWSVTIATITIALAVRHLRLLFPLVPLFMRAAGWQLDAVDTFDVNRSFCIYHPRDEVLPHRLSDAFSVLQQQHTDALRSFELSGAHPSLPCHMYPLHEHDDEWAQLLALLRSFVHD